MAGGARIRWHVYYGKKITPLIAMSYMTRDAKNRKEPRMLKGDAIPGGKMKPHERG
jgi:hypothetical protein